MSTRPSVFGYLDYRKFLQDTYAYLKETSPFFSYRYFSGKAGFSSQSVLRQVMAGERNIALGRTSRFSAALGLREREREYFRLLVLFCQSKGDDEKNRILPQLLAFGPRSDTKIVAERHYAIYGQWYVAAIRELVATKEFKEDHAWISRRLRPRVQPLQVKKAITLLLEAGFLQRERNGTLRVTDLLIKTPPEVASMAVRSFNRSMIEKGRDAIERVPSSQREISGMTIGCSNELFKAIKTRMQEFKDEILTLVGSEKGAGDEVFQINFQAFPLSGPAYKRRKP